MPTVYDRALLEPADDGGYGVIFPEVPGCTSGGGTADEATRNAAEDLAGHLVLLLEDGDPIPPPAPLDARLPDWLDEPGEPPAAGLVRLLVAAELPGKGQDGWMSRSGRGWRAGSTPPRRVSRSALLAEVARRMSAEER